jgi:hypothetical protein
METLLAGITESHHDSGEHCFKSEKSCCYIDILINRVKDACLIQQKIIDLPCFDKKYCFYMSAPVRARVSNGSATGINR